MNENDIKTQIQDAKKPTDTKKQKDTDSARRIVEKALEVSTNENTDLLNDIFFASLKKIKLVSDADYLKYRAQLTKLDGYTARDVDKTTKIYKSDRVNFGIGDIEADNKRGKDLKLAELAKQKAEFFHDSDNECWMRAKVANTPNEQGKSEGHHLETYRIKSEAFKDWCEHNYYLEYGDGVGDSAMKNAIDILRPFAKYSDAEHDVFIRYAYKDNTVYIDMTDDNWRVIKVDATGWEILESQESPVRFTRESHMRPLPEPDKEEGNLDLLWQALPVTDEKDRRMLIVYLINTMLSDSDYLMLEIGGIAGSAKSGAQVIIRSILDPSIAALVDYSGKLDDIPVLAKASYIVGYENMSHLSKQMQNRFCRMLTGGTMATRNLHTTDELKVWSIKTPIIINGIEELVTEPDLMQRTLSLEMPLIKSWGSKKAVIEKWESLRPLVLGGLYGLLSKTLYERERTTIKESKVTRQVDFLIDGQAVFDALGIDESFENLAKEMQKKAAERNADNCPVIKAIIKLVDSEKVNIRYTPTELLKRLDTHYKPDKYDPKKWIDDPIKLGNIIKKQTDTLKKLGISIRRTRSNSKRYIHLEKYQEIEI